jgi:hypothetical protein
VSNPTTPYLSKLEFGSFLSYSPMVTSDAEQRAYNVMLALKRHTPVSSPSRFIPETISKHIKENLAKLPFEEFFTTNPRLIPVPKSSRMRPGDLWVPQRIANALMKTGLGKAVDECLIRHHAVPKSATSKPADRPTVVQHYDSLVVNKILPEPEQILLIDDVITRGATVVAAASRLASIYPKSRIRSFAAMRAMTYPFRFNRLVDPCKGDITFNGRFIHREP